MAENSSLFREKPMENVSSPESINDYLKVTSPRVWFALVAVCVVLLGAIVWGFLGHIDATETVAVVSDGSETLCLVPADCIDAVISNPEMTLNDETIRLAPDVLEPVSITDDTNVYILIAGNLTSGDVVYRIKAETDMEEGVYSGKIVTESITPASFLIN